MKIRILNISDSDKDRKFWIDEFKKRLWNKLEIENIKPEKNWTKENIINKETDKIIKKIDKENNYKILLDIDWEQLNSIELAKQINKLNHITFIIAWPYWLNKEKISKYINKKISLWRITMPHWLAKLVLLEQIYRSWTINTNKKYHY